MGRAIYPHQRIVIIHRCDLPNDERYTSDGDLAVINAMRRMTGNQSSGFYLWNVLRMNEDGFQLAMSDARLKSVYNMSEKIYRSGWSILQAEGFIQLVNGRTYDFYEYPNEHISENSKTVSKEVLKLPQRQFKNYPKGSFKTTPKGRETYKDNIEHINNNPPSPKGEREKRKDFIGMYRRQMEEAESAGNMEESAVWYLLMEIQREYPFFTSKRGNEPADIGRSWIDVFAGLEFTKEDFSYALADYKRSEKAAYPPTANVLIESIRERQKMNDARLSFVEY